ncbi:MAG: hypothetical protein DRP41_00255 [Thermodesulfobacteriota bacterium]|nr:MAG: hypothetical protein DRP41_00255 [Thermodesulfobacteriota bacterium]
MKKWLLCDFHIHTKFSDGELDIYEVIDLFGSDGMDVIAITDHVFDTQHPHSLKMIAEGKSVKDFQGYFSKIEEASNYAFKKYGLLVIPGLEICNYIYDYHILAIDVSYAIDPDLPPQEVISAIHKQSGLAIACHPYYKLSEFYKGNLESIHNHPIAIKNHAEKYEYLFDAWEIANRYDLYNEIGLKRYSYLANSDFHKKEHIYSWKTLIKEEKDIDSIKEAIKAGKDIAIILLRKEDEGKVAKDAKGLWSYIHSQPQIDLRHKDGTKILIVDDEGDVVNLIEYHLKKYGYSCLKAYNGLQALKTIESERPDLLILDLMLPQIDGWELCHILRKNSDEKIKNLPIIMLTARASVEDRAYGLEIGADDYMIKPFSIAELIERIKRLLGRQKQDI